MSPFCQWEGNISFLPFLALAFLSLPLFIYPIYLRVGSDFLAFLFLPHLSVCFDGCMLFGINTLWLADPDTESNLIQLCLFVFFQTLFPANSIHEPYASTKSNYLTHWYLFFSHFSTVPIPSALPDLLLPPLSYPNSYFLSAAFSATSPTQPKTSTSSFNSHIS